MIGVRSAVAGDGDVLGEIHAESWQVAYAGFFTPEFGAEQIASRRGRWTARIGDGTLLIGEVDGRPLAFSWCHPSPERPGFAEVTGFYGHPDGWGSGVAAVLMTETLRALRQDFERAHLWTMRDTPQSRRFYAKSGFAETGATRTTDFGDGQRLVQVEYQRELEP